MDGGCDRRKNRGDRSWKRVERMRRGAKKFKNSSLDKLHARLGVVNKRILQHCSRCGKRK